MWIKGNILLSRQLSINELARQFPENETEVDEQEVVINTRNIPFFAEHKLFLKTINSKLSYKLWVPSLGPLIFFMYLSVVFLAGFTNWKMIVVGSIIVTGIAFAIYVINDKGARNYLHRHIDSITEENIITTGQNTSKDNCPACNTHINPYTKVCPGCGLHLRNAKKLNSKDNNTAPGKTKVHYHLKK